MLTKIKNFPWSSASNTSLTAELNSGSAKRVHQDNSSDKHYKKTDQLWVCLSSYSDI